jgi:DNA-3-methyladenine glycosylase I
VRNRLKVAASIANARATLELYEEGGSLDALLWSFVDGRPETEPLEVSMSEIPAITPQAEAMSKELKRRGFRFIGPTVMYAHMQATGMVNDHLVSCPRHAEVRG